MSNQQKSTSASKPVQQSIQRRRKQNLDGFNQKLKVPDVQALSDYALRWMNDVDGRCYYKNTEDDWDFVKVTEIGNVPIGDNPNADERGVGGNVAKRVGTDERGNPIWAFLMKKRKAFYDADYKEAQRHLDQLENRLHTGGDHEIENRVGTLKLNRGT